MASWYDKLDSYLLGVLPGGVSPGTTPSTLALAEAAGMGGAIGAEQVQPQGVSPMTVFGGPTTVQAGAARRPGGRLMTAVARIYPDGTMEPISMTPGGVALYRRDLNACKRVRTVQKTVNRLFPVRRIGKGKAAPVRIIRLNGKKR